MDDPVLQYIQDLLMCEDLEDDDKFNAYNSVETVSKELEELLEDRSYIGDASFGAEGFEQGIAETDVPVSGNFGTLIFGSPNRLDSPYQSNSEADLLPDEDRTLFQQYHGKDCQRQTRSADWPIETQSVSTGFHSYDPDNFKISSLKVGVKGVGVKGLCAEAQSGICWHRDPSSQILCLNHEQELRVSSPEYSDNLLVNDMQQVIDRKGDNRITVNYEESVTLGNQEAFPLNSSENVTGDQSSRQIPGREMEPSSPVPANLLEQLLDCARAVEADDLEKVNEIVEKLRSETSPTGDCYQRLGFYFVEALVARVWRAGSKMCFHSPSPMEILKAYHLFLDTTPYIKIPHYFATQTILKACKGERRLHIVDYGILYGIQWPALIQALADRPEGPPKLRITGIHFPMPDLKPLEKTELTASRLAEFARRCGVPFEYHSVKAKWDQILPSALMIRHDEILIVNCMFSLRHLLDETVAAESPRKRVLKNIRAMNPKVFIEGVMNAAFNTPLGFIHRFRAVLDHSINTFEAIDASIPWHSPERVNMESQFFANAESSKMAFARLLSGRA
ncbi:hypothetical protein O6H91_02G089900 [Diphasiastrum complanatum]|uniref:Uncharacterized protein n=1 Tax=Diphasiastrum complanatum TaxID=34168 RepID=A0ACC2EI17_DIPCM|nr:hypothetical protein O6H91_02G089900 [Diphasiastrum complanatum]